MVILEDYSNIIFHENPSNGSRFVPCGRTDRQTDTTKLTVAFRNFAAVVFPGIFVGGGGVQQIQLRTEDRENGDLEAIAL